MRIVTDGFAARFGQYATHAFLPTIALLCLGVTQLQNPIASGICQPAIVWER